MTNYHVHYRRFKLKNENHNTAYRPLVRDTQIEL